MDRVSANSTPKPAWVRRWLAMIRDTGNVRLACHAAKVDRSTPYKLRTRDQEFAAEWDEAMEDACDNLESVARQRALESSDQLLMFLLKANRPAKYRERLTVDTIKRFEDMSDDDITDFIAKRLIAADAAGEDSAGDAAVAAAGGDDPASGS